MLTWRSAIISSIEDVLPPLIKSFMFVSCAREVVFRNEMKQIWAYGSLLAEKPHERRLATGTSRLCRDVISMAYERDQQRVPFIVDMSPASSSPTTMVPLS